MKTYVVGGAVRDRLLGLPVVDRDHVVVGATVSEMLAADYKPVGKDFPVFLHPVTHEEYALARTERKVAPGYAGFVFHADPSVTLEADLERRDLTINAIAEDETTGRLVDPFGGQRDLVAKVFRHVGPAFSEDPVRLLRTARFAARFVDFTLAPETLRLMREMAGAGEVDALVPERVWQEVSRGLMEVKPSRMLVVLHDAGALVRALPELEPLFVEGTATSPTLVALDRAAAAGADLAVRFAVLVARVAEPSDAVAAIRGLCARIAVPGAVRDLALVVARERDRLIEAARSDDPAVALVAAMERSDGFRRFARFGQAVDASGFTIDDGTARARVVETARRVADAARTVDIGAIARTVGFDPASIAERGRAARIAAARERLGGASRA